MVKKARREYLAYFFEEFEYPSEAVDSLMNAYDRLAASEEAWQKLTKLINAYEKDILCDWNNMISETKLISEIIGVHEYEGALLILILLSQSLKNYYKRFGVDESIWKTSIFDIKYKMIKCKILYGVWGIFLANWFSGFFQLTRVGFEKLQFEVIDFGRTYVIDGLLLEPSSKVINIHIPRTGTPLDKEGRLIAYSKAKEYFKEYFPKGKTPFVCHSWLLFGKNKEILSPDSNLCSFIDDFRIIEEEYYPDYSQTWRIFDTLDVNDIEKLPEKTSLQRGYKELMRRGEKTGAGYGIFVL